MYYCRNERFKKENDVKRLNYLPKIDNTISFLPRYDLWNYRNLRLVLIQCEWTEPTTFQNFPELGQFKYTDN